MFKLVCRLFTAFAVVAASISSTYAVTLVTFDDLTGTQFFNSSIPYQGLTFLNTPAASSCNCDPGSWYWSDLNSPNPLFATPSTSVSTQAYTVPTFTESAHIVFSSPVNFIGASFASVAPIPGISVQFELYYLGVLVGESDVLSGIVAGGGSTFLSSVSGVGGYTGPVDEIGVFGYQGFFAMDNVLFNALPVPEPASYAMLLAGLGVVGFAARRRRAIS